jgi:hypothetical protein
MTFSSQRCCKNLLESNGSQCQTVNKQAYCPHTPCGFAQGLAQERFESAKCTTGLEESQKHFMQLSDNLNWPYSKIEVLYPIGQMVHKRPAWNTEISMDSTVNNAISLYRNQHQKVSMQRGHVAAISRLLDQPGGRSRWYESQIFCKTTLKI